MNSFMDMGGGLVPRHEQGPIPLPEDGQSNKTCWVKNQGEKSTSKDRLTPSWSSRLVLTHATLSRLIPFESSTCRTCRKTSSLVTGPYYTGNGRCARKARSVHLGPYVRNELKTDQGPVIGEACG